MHIVVLVAGIGDPKRPLQKPASGNWADLVQNSSTPFKLSPFDEAALEIALKLRDKDSDISLTALVTDGASDLQLMRAVASYRIDRVSGLLPPSTQRGNPAWLASQLSELFREFDHPVDLVLMGREHGDMDDGMLPAYLAEYWGWPFICQALDVKAAGSGRFVFERSSSTSDESITLSVPACASISNDKSNRLRHPLMKNVMLAKQQKFEMLVPVRFDQASNLELLKANPPETSLRGAEPCNMLTGSTVEQAEALAAYLRSLQAG